MARLCCVACWLVSGGRRGMMRAWWFKGGASRDVAKHEAIWLVYAFPNSGTADAAMLRATYAELNVCEPLKAIWPSWYGRDGRVRVCLEVGTWR